MSRNVLGWLLGPLFTSLGVSSLMAQPLFIPLGYLDGNGPTSEANAITPDGARIVGYSTTSLTENQACWWTSAGIAPLPGMQNWYANSAYGVSAEGTVIVGDRSFGGTEEAFYWTPATQIQLVPLPNSPSAATARAVTSDGQILVGAARVGGVEWRAFRWDRRQTSATYLPPYPGPAPNAGAFAISDDARRIVGQVQTSLSTYAAARWDDAGAPVLFIENGNPIVGISALGISADGSVVVGSGLDTSNGRGVAFKWTATGGTVALPNPTTGVYAILSATAVKVSGNGRVIVGYGENASGRDEAIFWVDDQPFRVSDIAYAAGVLPPSWEPFRAYGVDHDGNSICGYGQATSGKLEAYLLVRDNTPDPPLAAPTLSPTFQAGTGTLSIRFLTTPGLRYRVRGGGEVGNLAPVGDWFTGTGAEQEFLASPAVTGGAPRFFLDVEVAAL